MPLLCLEHTSTKAQADRCIQRRKSDMYRKTGNRQRKKRNNNKIYNCTQRGQHDVMDIPDNLNIIRDFVRFLIYEANYCCSVCLFHVLTHICTEFISDTIDDKQPRYYMKNPNANIFIFVSDMILNIKKMGIRFRVQTRNWLTAQCHWKIDNLILSWSKYLLSENNKRNSFRKNTHILFECDL